MPEAAPEEEARAEAFLFPVILFRGPDFFKPMEATAVKIHPAPVATPISGPAEAEAEGASPFELGIIQASLRRTMFARRGAMEAVGSALSANPAGQAPSLLSRSE